MRGINRQLCDIESRLAYRAPPARGAPVHRYFRHSARPPVPAQLVPRPLRTRPYPRDIAPGRRSRRRGSRTATFRTIFIINAYCLMITSL